MTSLRILFLAAEVAPFAKSGGLADVAGSLPKALRRLGHDVRVIMPRYGSIHGEEFGLHDLFPYIYVHTGPEVRAAGIEVTEWDGVPTYFIRYDAYFRRDRLYGYGDDVARFGFYCAAAADLLRDLDWQPDVFHANDWHTAVAVVALRRNGGRDPFYAPIASVYTIHNLAFQGVTDRSFLASVGLSRATPHLYDELDGTVNWMAQAIYHADMVSTVSPRYAEEIQAPEGGMGLHQLLRYRSDRLVGILNGIDYELYNPWTDPDVAVQFDIESLNRRIENKRALQAEVGLPVDDRAPLAVMVGRLDVQKGYDILVPGVEDWLRQGGQLAVLGTGQPGIEEALRHLAWRYPHSVAVALRFDAVLSSKLFAGGDLFLIPSRFEPCGLTQMIAMRYGCLPVARAVGGLADTVTSFDPDQDTGMGFVFREYTAAALASALQRAWNLYRDQPDAWRRLQQRAMRADFSWSESARKYVQLYRTAMETHGSPALLATAG